MSEWSNGTKPALVRQWNPYPAYKPSGVSWMCDVPSHWQVKPLKCVCGMNNSVLTDATAPDFEVQYVDIGNVDSLGRILEEQTVLFVKAPSRARRRVRDGDTIISTVRTYLKAIAYMDNPPPNRIVSTGFAVLRPDPCIEPRFLWRAVQSAEFVDAVVAHSEGIGYPAINPGQLGSLRVCVPTFEEQRRITTFLDRETAKIDALIAKKERLIELLQEKRTALVTHAVTKGLDPSVPTRDSGIEWVGKIPGHWQTRRAKFLFRQSSLPVREGDGVVTAFRDGQVTLRENRRTEGFTFAILEIGYQGIRKGQLVLHSMDAFAGAIGVSESDGKCSPEYVVCDPVSNEVLPDYYAPCLREMSRQNFIEVSCKAVRERAPRLRFATFGEMVLPFPPRAEQLAIADRIRKEVAKSQRQIALFRQSIDKLREYRTALISAAVTGKIDLREEGRT